MAEQRKTNGVTPTGVVIVPLAVISVVFALITMVVIASDRIYFVSTGTLLISGIVLYAATIFLLSRSGFANMREFEQNLNHDPLTGLPARKAFRRDVEIACQPHENIAIATINLDGFKHVNDHYDHEVGDELIKVCGQLLREACANEAKCYRLGGDEFAAVITGQVAGTILEGICRSFLERLSKPIPVGDRRVPIGASVGLAQSAQSDGISFYELLRRSDVALYMSKKGGKNRCTWFSKSFDEHRDAMRELDGELRSALANNQFKLVYQPMLSAETGKIETVEALMRWTRENGEIVPPNTFIPVAEESGLINAIGSWVLREATTTAMKWGDITLSVNISAAQLRNPEFPILLGQILEETGYPPERLELEVTETSLVFDPVVAERSLDVIRGFGVKISLDDFGTGYASIGFLRQFRFEKLKLDRSLVAEASADDSSRAMMLSTIAIARALGMEVTAEGVETEAHAELARAAGCDQLQGWLYFRPLPEDEIDELVASNKAELTQTENSHSSSSKEQAA